MLNLSKEGMLHGTLNSQQTNVIDRPSSSSINPGPVSESDHIRTPHYQAYNIRLSSFARLPSDSRQRPEQMAAAGFYYTGLQDTVRCFACDGEVTNWNREIEPWIEHGRCFPQCLFVKLVKGQAFITGLRRMAEDSGEEEGECIHSTLQPINPMASSSSMRERLNLHENDENVLETEAAKCVLDVGYSSEKAARTIKEFLAKGNVDYTSMNIINIFMEQEHRADETDGNINHTPTPRPSTRRNDLKQSIIEDNTRLRKLLLCAVCKVTEKEICLLPCMHLCLCSTSADKRLICPICHKKISDKLKTLIRIRHSLIVELERQIDSVKCLQNVSFNYICLMAQKQRLCN